MWTPLGLFLYVSISILTETSMHNLHESGIKVLKFKHVSGAEECNLTCASVTDQDGLQCNWVVIEENQNLCIYLHCLDISVCEGATVEHVKALQIGKNSPIKTFLHPGQRKVRSVVTIAAVTSSETTTPAITNGSSVTNRSISAAVTNSSTESTEGQMNTTNATATASTPSTQFSSTSGTISSTSATLTTVTTTDPTTNNSKTNNQVTSISATVSADWIKNESSTIPNIISKDSTTSLQSSPITTKLLSSTPKTTQSSTSLLTTVTPTKGSTTQLIPEVTTRQEQQGRTDASTITGGVSQSPKIKSRTTVAFNHGKNYIFPSVPAGDLIKYLADTSSLMAILIFGLLFFLVSIMLFAHKAFESYKRKDYVQVDYLINGMYADSDM